MKYILQIAAGLRIGGAEKVTRDIGLYPDPGEYENHYVVFGPKIGDYEAQLESRGCRIFHLDPPGESYPRFLKSLKQIMAAYPYTAVHAHTMFNSGWAMYLAKKMGIPVRVTHSHSALDTSGGLKTTAYETLMRHLILSCATDLVTCGEKAGIRLYGPKAYAERGKLILNGVDVESFRFRQDSRDAIRSQLGLEDSFVIGHAGHLAEVKNQKFLIDLMPRLLEQRSNAKLLLLGEGEDRAMLEQRIADLGMQEHIIMTGNVLNVADYLCAMDVFAFPSLYEGMPLSIVEVQANGLPCVLSTGVPKDVYLTDLIRPLTLEQPQAWIDAICASRRSDSACYADRLMASGYDVKTAMEKIYDVYEGKT